MATWLIILVTAAATLLAGGLLLFLAYQLAAPEKEVRAELEHLHDAEDPQFLRDMGTLFTAPLAEGNAVTALRNGDEIFPAMLDAIGSACETITFETFIYWSGLIGRRFTRALAERARSGVAVHVLLDWVGSLPMDEGLVREMEQAGVEVRRYHRPTITRPHRTNHRTHRKLLVVDGRVGFTGGVGIGDVWLGDAEDPQHWRDSHFRIEGPAVGGLQRAFMDNWLGARGKVLHGPRYFPPLERAGDALCQVLQSSPEGGSDSVRLMFLLAITAASRSVRISTAYFVPDEHTLDTLRAAVRRGVRIELIVPGEHNDSRLVRLASSKLYGALLRERIDVYEYQPTMYHTKSMIIDECWVCVGSTNFDNRSFRLNDEVTIGVFDRGFARQQIEWFEADKARSSRVELAQWERRPLQRKLAEHAASLLSSQI